MKHWKVIGSEMGGSAELVEVRVIAADDYEARRTATFEHRLCVVNVEPATALLPMDIACLTYLAECDGSAPTIAIPAKLFHGEIPDGAQSLVDLRMIEHLGEITHITAAGRAALAMSSQHRETP